jgi:hypothetical protein
MRRSERNRGKRKDYSDAEEKVRGPKKLKTRTIKNDKIFKGIETIKLGKGIKTGSDGGKAGDHFPLCAKGKEENWKPTEKCKPHEKAKAIAKKVENGIELTRLASGKGANVNHNANASIRNVQLKNLEGAHPRGELTKDVEPNVPLYTFYPGSHRRANGIHYPAMTLNENISANVEVKPIINGLTNVFFPLGNAPDELKEFEFPGSEPLMRVFDIHIKKYFNKFTPLKVCRVIDTRNFRKLSKKKQWKKKKIWGKSRKGALVLLRINEEETMVVSEIIPTSRENGFQDSKKEKNWYKKGTKDVEKGMLLSAFLIIPK